jgi:SAM-dependent methyltransferase
MEGAYVSEAIIRFFDLQRTYDRMYHGYRARGVKTVLDPNDKEFAPQTPVENYLSVGADALRIIINVLVSNLREPPQSILDFPSGSGRVTRHLRAFFSESRIVACDLYDYHVNFCVRELGTEGMISRENFDEIDFGDRFGLIFCGSLLTHLSQYPFQSAMRLLSRSLSENGVAIVSLHGRHSEYIQKHKWKYIDDSLYAIVESTIPETGFGYVDYGQDAKGAYDRQVTYGLSFSRPRWTLQTMEQDYNIRILGYVERAWDDHHDILVFGRPGIND